MKILGIIPARGGSKGVPGKNIKFLGSKPLIAYTIESALSTNLIQDVVVSTDSIEIKEVAIQFGVQVPFIRPDFLSSDTAKSIDVVIHAIEFLKNKGKVFDAVMLLQPTNPFRTKEFIEEAIHKFNEEQLDSLISVLPVPLEYNPHWIFEENEKGYLSIATGETEIIPRRQDLPKAYFRDGSIYLTSTQVLMEYKTFYGKKLGFIVASENRHINIDTMEDWRKAEIFLDNNKL